MAIDRPKINFVVGEKFNSFTEFETKMKLFQESNFVQLYKRSSIKIGVKNPERDNKQRTCVPGT